jgi:hypothetical protein
MIKMEWQRVYIVSPIITLVTEAIHYLCYRLVPQSATVWCFSADRQTAEDEPSTVARKMTGNMTAITQPPATTTWLSALAASLLVGCLHVIFEMARISLPCRRASLKSQVLKPAFCRVTQAQNLAPT